MFGQKRLLLGSKTAPKVKGILAHTGAKKHFSEFMRSSLLIETDELQKLLED